MDPLLSVRNLKKSFSVRGPLLQAKTRELRAVDDISFDLFPGDCLGLVGESGCGKSTVARLLLGLIRPDSGQVYFMGKNLTELSRRQMLPLRQEIQMIFQDPFSSLNPRMQVGEILAEPFKIHGRLRGIELRTEIIRLLSTVGLSERQMQLYPHEFSGGQRQRIGIARALALRPKLIVADEPVSALDVSIQAQVLNLLQDIQQQYGLSYLFISHDLSVIDHLCNRVAVMYLGRIVEYGTTDELIGSPRHPYTETLLSAVPVPDPSLPGTRIIPLGDPPSAIDPPCGCHYHPRCPYARPLCKQSSPALREVRPGHLSACHFSDDVGTQSRRLHH